MNFPDPLFRRFVLVILALSGSLVDVLSAAYVSLGNVPVDWRVSAAVDFNGDGKPDIFLSNTVTGDQAVWLMNGTSVSTNAYVSNAPTSWMVSGTGDFNGDGKADIILSNTVTGDRAMWLMNGTAISTNAYLGSVPTAWVISAVADFNSDGKADILLSNTVTGDRAMWLMNGTAISTNAYLGNVPTAWVVSASADYNSDGRADILWTNTGTGEHSLWLMNGITTVAGANLYTLSTNMSINGTADINGDVNHYPDVLFTNIATGDRGFYLMNGPAMGSWIDLGIIPLTWRIAATANFNGPTDIKSDLLLENTSTGDRLIWLMNGTGPDLSDSNGNGLPDIWEIFNFSHLGVDPNSDPDGDGLTNLKEYQLGNNPNVADAPLPPAGVSLVLRTPNSLYYGINTTTWSISPL